MNEPAILTEDLTYFYGRHRGIEGLDLRVERGEVFGFLGPNGAGKTTTIRLLLDLIRPTRGRAAVLGFDCRRDSLAVRRNVGYLPGEYNLYENLTGRQTLEFLGALHGGEGMARADDYAGRLGADLTRPLRTLSHGNKQKLALLVALAPAAEVLVLDEPTTGLDPLVRQEVYALLGEARREGRTVFLSSHDLAEVEKVCDRVASVRDGLLVDVSEVAALRQQALRVVELVCEREPDPARLARVAGVSKLRVDGTRVTCRVQGAPGPLLAAAAEWGVADLLSREPNLEEFFLALYGRHQEDGRRVP